MPDLAALARRLDAAAGRLEAALAPRGEGGAGGDRDPAAVAAAVAAVAECSRLRAELAAALERERRLREAADLVGRRLDGAVGELDGLLGG